MVVMPQTPALITRTRVRSGPGAARSSSKTANPPSDCAPTAPTWGHNNRTVALRIPIGDPAARRIERVLWNDPASGVMRHADAGYEEALVAARERGLDLPGTEGSGEPQGGAPVDRGPT